MGLARRWAQKRSKTIDTNRWAMAAPMLNGSEDRLHNTPAKTVYEGDDRVDGFLFLTSEAILAVEGEGRRGVRIDLEKIRFVGPDEGHELRLRIGWLDDRGDRQALIWDLYPSLLSKELWDTLNRLVQEHGLTLLDD